METLDLDHVSPTQLEGLHKLVEATLRGKPGSRDDWAPFEPILLDAGIDRSNREHLRALCSALVGSVLKVQKAAWQAERTARKQRLAAIGALPRWIDTRTGL